MKVDFDDSVWISWQDGTLVTRSRPDEAIIAQKIVPWPQSTRQAAEAIQQAFLVQQQAIKDMLS